MIKKYYMGECGIAVSIELCTINNKKIIIDGWHINNEKIAIQNLIEKLDKISNCAQEKIKELKK